LSDPDVKQIPWEQIELGARIGSGASGIVYAGIWMKKFVTANNINSMTFYPVTNKYDYLTCSGSEQVPVAIKKMMFDFASIPKQTLDEFLVEIKLMRYVSFFYVAESEILC
jgi:hypothetical protein